jgi:glycosyltransferase involved in cell wall biosynthesis
MTAKPTDIVPGLSFVMPCYNEEESIPVTIPRLFAAFEAAGHAIEIVAVNNGSRDRTAQRLAELQQKHPNLRIQTVEQNRGYGFGILSGLPVCRGQWVGFIPADGQIDAEDVVRIWDSAAASRGDVVAKARRRFRLDGFRRKVVSVAYNLLIRMLWPRLDSLDVNGTPKILPREALMRMDLQSTGWFLDPELMIKAHYMGLRVLEFNVFARMRGSGVSHVRAETCVEFLRNLLRYRFSRQLVAWRRSLPTNGPSGKPTGEVLTGSGAGGGG